MKNDQQIIDDLSKERQEFISQMQELQKQQRKILMSYAKRIQEVKLRKIRKKL